MYIMSMIVVAMYANY